MSGTGFPRGVVFDLDGTLVDSLPDIAGALNDLMAMRGLARHPADAVRRMIGKGVPVLVERGFAAHGIALDEERRAVEIAAYLALYEPRATRETRPYPGATAAVERLAREGVAIGICTNKPTGISREILERFDLLRYCRCVVGGDFGPPRKPAPDLLQAALGLMGVVAGEAVMVGDSEADVAASRAAGVRVVALGHGYSASAPEALGADVLIAGFAHLPAALDRLREARHERT